MWLTVRNSVYEVTPKNAKDVITTQSLALIAPAQRVIYVIHEKELTVQVESALLLATASTAGGADKGPTTRLPAKKSVQTYQYQKYYLRPLLVKNKHNMTTSFRQSNRDG